MVYIAPKHAAPPYWHTDDACDLLLYCDPESDAEVYATNVTEVTRERAEASGRVPCWFCTRLIVTPEQRATARERVTEAG